jgi:predicted transcriptional regulator
LYLFSSELSVSNEHELRKLVADVAAAYFTNSHVTPAEIPNVMQHIAASLSAVGSGEAAPVAEPAAAVEATPATKLSPAQISRSITPEVLISFEDGKPYKTLRRHLAAKGLTPEQYRIKWGLPPDYPMVAPAYSKARSQMAKANGLGGSRARARPEPAAAARPRRAGPRTRRDQTTA